MAKRSRRSIDERLLAAQVAIDNALGDAEVLAALGIFGYDQARLQAGRALYEEAQALVNRQKAEYGDQFEATAALQAAWDEADAAYMRALKVARLALKDNPKARAAMMLGGRRKQSLSGWIEQATAFYANLLDAADLMAAMGGFGYDQVRLEAEQALVQAAVTANLTQEKEKGEAREATAQRDAKLDELDEWMSDFKVIAVLALEENRQRLEKLGFSAVS